MNVESTEGVELVTATLNITLNDSQLRAIATYVCEELVRRYPSLWGR